MQERKKKILEMLTEAEGQFNSSYTKQTHKTNQPTTQKNSQNLHKKSQVPVWLCETFSSFTQ